MAVLRATQLFVHKCAPSGRSRPTPATPTPSPLPETPETRAYELVYTVPPGKRAILRCFTAVLGNIPPQGTEPDYWVQLTGPDIPGTYFVHWYWFVDHTSGTGMWQLCDTWEPMLVMNEYQQLYVANQSTQFMSVTGSGHLVDVRT